MKTETSLSFTIQGTIDRGILFGYVSRHLKLKSLHVIFHILLCF
jgi:hypothetical protein